MSNYLSKVLNNYVIYHISPYKNNIKELLYFIASILMFYIIHLILSKTILDMDKLMVILTLIGLIIQHLGKSIIELSNKQDRLALSFPKALGIFIRNISIIAIVMAIYILPFLYYYSDSSIELFRKNFTISIIVSIEFFIIYKFFLAFLDKITKDKWRAYAFYYVVLLVLYITSLL